MPVAAGDPVQEILDGGKLKTAYNPVLLDYLVEEARGETQPSPKRSALA